ncbi:MAG TPA: DUF924 family protein [Steroidobacteraceae bacterium]|jgi:uncharacterized protein (DUF924 family)|nr:DUF924 family protein [Steroidobacteraceae bacterium]
MDDARSVRDFWFGRVPLSAGALEQRMRFWFGAGDSELRARRDEQIRVRFGAVFDKAITGALASWADGPRRRLSLVIVLDQFPRNMFRGSARAFAYDGQALGLTLSGMQSAADAALDVIERLFFYMPLQHAENSEAQEESVAAYRRLLSEAPAQLLGPFQASLRSAENHRRIIARFGRFPYRNAALGRASSPEEQDWLRHGGESFGQ